MVDSPCYTNAGRCLVCIAVRVFRVLSCTTYGHVHSSGWSGCRTRYFCGEVSTRPAWLPLTARAGGGGSSSPLVHTHTARSSPQLPIRWEDHQGRTLGCASGRDDGFFLVQPPWSGRRRPTTCMRSLTLVSYLLAAAPDAPVWALGRRLRSGSGTLRPEPICAVELGADWTATPATSEPDAISGQDN